MAGKTTKSSVLVNLSITVISVSLCLATVEGILRLGWISNPMHHRIHPSFPSEIPIRFKLMILGDSFIYAGGELDRLLRSQLTPEGIQIYNLAEPGNGPLSYLTEMKAFVKTIKPDAILLCYNGGNDLTQLQYRMKEWERPSVKIKNFLRPYIRRLYLYHFLKRRLAPFFPAAFNFQEFMQKGYDSEMLKKAEESVINRWMLPVSKDHPRFLIDNLLIETPASEEAWKRGVEIFDKIYSLSENVKADLWVLVFPSSLQINKKQFPFHQSLRFELDERTLESDKPQSLMREYTEERNIPYLDLLPAYREHREEDYFLENDPHFNSRGNALSADLIYEFIDSTLRR